MESQGPQIQQETPKVQQDSKLPIFLTALASIALTSLLVGGGLYYWQRSESEKIQKSFRQQITDLESNLGTVRDDLNQAASEKENLTRQLEDLKRKTCKGEWKDGICVMATCVDSDVNEKPNDIYIKGNVTHTDENGVETVVYDECTGSKTQVNEKWCYESPSGSGNYVPGTTVYDCPKGCLDGACIR